MKIVIIVGIATFVIASVFTMYFTGTLGRIAQLKGKEGPDEGNNSPPPLDKVAKKEPAPDLHQGKLDGIKEPSTPLNGVAKDNTNAIQQAEGNLKGTEESGIPETLPAKEKTEALELELSKYKAQIAAESAKLSAIKAEIEHLSAIKADADKYQQLAKVYSAMRPNNAALILCELEEDMTKQILSRMSDRAAAKIMSAIADVNPSYGARISKLIVNANEPYDNLQ